MFRDQGSRRVLRVGIVTAIAASAIVGASPHATAQSTPIRIGHIGSYDNPNFNFTSTRDGAQAAVNSINAAGGIHGRKLQLVTCDDKTNPNAAAACGRQMAEDSSIVAVTGAMSLVSDSYVSVLESRNLPLIGNLPTGRLDGSSRISYPLIASTDIGFNGVGLNLIARKPKRPAIAYYDVGTGKIAMNSVREILNAAGIPPVATIAVPVGTPDFSPYMARIEEKNADFVSVIMDTTGVQRWAQTAVQTGSKATLVLSASIPADIKGVASLFEGDYVTEQYPPDGGSNPPPAYKRFSADIKRYFPKRFTTDNQMLNAWAGVQLFASVANGLPNVDRASVYAAMKKVSHYDSGGITPILDFTKPGPASDQRRIINPTMTFSQVRAGKKIELRRFVNVPKESAAVR